MIRALRFPTSQNQNSDSNIGSQNSDTLPAGWQQVTSRSTGKTYYLQESTGHTQWNRPVDESRANARNVTNVFSSGVSRMGAGLTSMFNSANTRLQETLNNNRSASASSRQSADLEDRQGQVTEEVFEYERLGRDLTGVDPKKFSDRNAVANTGSDELPNLPLPEGYEWSSEWEIDQKYTNVDKDGWTYGESFESLVSLLENDDCHASKHPNDTVRRRRWIRYRQEIQSGETNSQHSSDEVKGKSSATASTISSSSGSGTSSSSTLGGGSDLLGDDEDPFKRSQKSNPTSAFRVNMKFPSYGGKDHTKDYQNISMADIKWLVTSTPISEKQSVESIREKTANLEERIKEVAKRSDEANGSLTSIQTKGDQIVKEKTKKLKSLVSEYLHLRKDHGELLSQVEKSRLTVNALKKEAMELDSIVNEEQRAINAEMEESNQALEEKAKALSTARIRYKRDVQSLTEAIESASSRAQRKGASMEDNAIRSELKQTLKKMHEVKSKLDVMRQHRHAVEDDRRDMFSHVVEKKSDMKIHVKQKLEQKIDEVDKNIRRLKEEQSRVIKSYTQSNDPQFRMKSEARRNEIRSQLSRLKEHRAILYSQRKKQQEETF